MRKLVPEDVVIRRVTVVTAALAWNSMRYNPMVDVAVAWLKANQ
jgi:hypothetical protein